VLASVIAVSILKNLSQTSCPWDLQEFGGVARYVSHWSWGVNDGGPGGCFPAGHASAAFAYVGGYFVLRRVSPRVAAVWLCVAVVAGLVLGVAQQLRGAHYMSHTLWTAWVCWAVGFAIELAVTRRGARALASGARACRLLMSRCSRWLNAGAVGAPWTSSSPSSPRTFCRRCWLAIGACALASRRWRYALVTALASLLVVWLLVNLMRTVAPCPGPRSTAWASSGCRRARGLVFRACMRPAPSPWPSRCGACRRARRCTRRCWWRPWWRGAALYLGLHFPLRRRGRRRARGAGVDRGGAWLSRPTGQGLRQAGASVAARRSRGKAGPEQD
jgi:hypothetical protein